MKYQENHLSYLAQIVVPESGETRIENISNAVNLLKLTTEKTITLSLEDANALVLAAKDYLVILEAGLLDEHI